VTGKRLDNHPFTAQLDTCDSPGAVSDLLRTQAQAFSKSRKSDEKLMAWLDPTVHILSATLGERIGLVRCLNSFGMSFSDICSAAILACQDNLYRNRDSSCSEFISDFNFLLPYRRSECHQLLQAVKDVAASHRTIMHIFERIHLFLQRLNRHTGTSLVLTDDLTELLGKIMPQLLTILALSTKAMTDKRVSELSHSLCLSFLVYRDTEKFLKKLARRKGVEDAISRPDALTKEESMITVARNLNLEVTPYRVDGDVETTKVVTEEIDDDVMVAKTHTEDIDDSLKVTEAFTEDIDNNVKVAESRTEDGDDNVKSTEPLIEDIEDNMKVTKDLFEDTDDNMKVAEALTEDIDNSVKVAVTRTEDIDDNVKSTEALIEDNVKVTKDLSEDIDHNMKVTEALTGDIEDNVKLTKALTEDVDKNVYMTKALTEDIGEDVKETKDGTQHFLSIFIHVLTSHCVSK